MTDVDQKEQLEEQREHCRPSSIKGHWREFLVETSLHGCKHIVERHWTLARIIWTLLVMSMTLALGLVLTTLFFRYREYPFTTVWNARFENDTILPAFTICLPGYVDMGKLNKSSLIYDYISKRLSPVEFEEIFDSKEEMAEYLNRTEKALSNVSWSDFTRMTKFKREDIFFYIGFNGRILFPGKEIDLWMQDSNEETTACWVLNGYRSNSTVNRRVTIFDRIDIFLDVRSDRHAANVYTSGIELYVNENNKVREMPIFIRPGSSAQIFFSRTEHKYLPPPYRSFGKDECVDSGHELRNPLNISPIYSKSSCLIEHTFIKTVEKCKCVYAGVMKYFPNTPECSMLEFLNCFDPVGRQILYTLLIEKDLKETGCLRECNFATYDASVSTVHFPSVSSMEYFQNVALAKDINYARDNFVYITIRLKNEMVNIIEHVPEMTLISIFGIVGGYMGLFLGASVLTLTEFFERLIISICFLFKPLIIQRRGNK